MRRKRILGRRSGRSATSISLDELFVPRDVFVRFGEQFHYVTFSVRFQKIAAAVAALILAWVAYTGGSYVAHKITLAAKDARIAAQTREIAELKLRLSEAGRRRDGLEARIAALDGILTRKTRLVERATEQKTSLERQVSALKRGIVRLRDSEQSVLEELNERAARGIAHMERTVESVGLDPSTLIAGAKQTFASQGGPFVLANSTMAHFPPAAELEATISRLDRQLDRWHALQKLLRVLPLSAPLDEFRLSSGYGVRVDPVNRREAWHDGVDLSAPLGTPVYATAPGTVVFAGWRGGFGRMVEIDHGVGVRTRYAHLQEISVKKGQAVKNRQEVGLLGTSGRSTGAHVHYEIRYQDSAEDPIRFIRAGDYIFKN